jgi:glycerol-3-phosphate dehydrogenase
MQREEAIQVVQLEVVWDLVVIGGGATGLGIALDAAQRGLKTLLLEQDDFGKGTSSRSTKLVHGGVRYLQQGNVRLVLEALRERALLLRNAPHLVHRQPFLIPCYSVWQRPYYRVGLGLYDRLAGRESFGRSRSLNTDEACRHITSLVSDRLRGGVLYYDGQFDDARLAITLALTAHQQGATLLNYARVSALRNSGAEVTEVEFKDAETGDTRCVQAKVVVNATGIFVDQLRRQVEPGATSMLAHSQGAHIVLDYEWLGGKTALMVPRTEDGRVLFAIPWNGKVVVGTTDTPVDGPSSEPRAQEAELDFLVRHVAKYVGFQPDPSDVRSVFVGIRPLVKPSRGNRSTKRISREHVIEISPSGLITVTGGKWTTYRKMAADTVDQVFRVAGRKERPCGTARLPLFGADGVDEPGAHPEAEREENGFIPWNLYGTEAKKLEELVSQCPELREPIHPELPYRMAEVVWAARHEMARTLEDVLARRTRCLLLDARATCEAAPRVARLLAEELGKNESWSEAQLTSFRQLAGGYQMV